MQEKKGLAGNGEKIIGKRASCRRVQEISNVLK